MFCCNVTRCACGMHFDGVLAFLQYFSKAMQTKYGEYHILSSDLSSKVQVKIRSKVRGLFKRHFVWTGRFFVEFSWRSENSRWKASFRSIVFKISLWTIVNRGDYVWTDNRLLGVIKFVYTSCNEHGISPNVFPNFSFTKTRYENDSLYLMPNIGDKRTKHQ